MLNQLKKNRSQKGFTIIEVMIVLAIAALILLIVFLAVPALQRSSRNTQRKNDVSNLDTSIGNYISDNNGTLPNSQGLLQTAAQDSNPGYYVAFNSAPSGGAGLYYGDNTDIPTSAVVGGTGGGASTLTTENVIFFSGTECSGNTPVTAGASPRSFTLEYAVETGSSATVQCLGS